MNKILRRFKPVYGEAHNISKAQISAAFEREQMRNYPFVSLSLFVLFLLYALVQKVILQENQAPLMVAIAAISALAIGGLGWAVRKKDIPQRWANPLYGFTVILVLLSMLLRLYFTGDARQTANLAFFLVGIGVLLFSMRWFLAILLLTISGWLVGALLAPPQEEWVFYSIVFLAAGITGSLTQFVLTEMYERLEVLRIENSRLYQLSKQFNERLEEKVRERTQELQEAYGRLERLDKTKADFITIASHELRTPLTILNTHNQILLQDEEIQRNKAQLKQVQGIHKGAARMEEILGAMLDVAKIDSQTLSLNLAPVKLALFIRIVSQQFDQALLDRSLTLRIEDLGQLPDIEADAEALKKVFHHLIANAIKYTPDGGQILVKGINHITEVEIIIADSGIGIAVEAQSLIFEKFYQTGEVKLHSSGKTAFKGGGSGLGLAIVKGIVEAHNGRIWVESQGYDEQTLPGSTFHLILPVQH